MVTLENAIIAARTPEFTYFFKMFPYLVNETFYIRVIALGYWLAYNPRIFWQLGFLVPFSTMLNGVLKNIFLWERPDLSLHLVQIVDKSSGFPSGDVHVASVLWGMLLYHFQSRILRFFGVAIILCIMLSRVYLGVHTVDQVFGGLFFGLATVCVASSNGGQKMFNNWQNGQTKTYWLLCSFVFTAYITLSQEILPMMVGIAGVLIGYGITIFYAQKYMTSLIRGNILSFCFGISTLWLANQIFPRIHFKTIALVDAFFLVKYAIISFIIFAFVPVILLKNRTLSRNI